MLSRFRWWILLAGFVLSFTFASNVAFSQLTDAATTTDEYLDEKRETFAWLLGTWESTYEGTGPFARARSGATLIFTLESDGRVIGRIGKTSEMMREAGYREGMYVFRGLDRPFTNAPGTSIYAVRTGEGQFRHISTSSDEWRDTLIAIHQGDPKLQLLPTAKGSLSGHAEWIKINGATIEPTLASGTKCSVGTYTRFMQDEAEKLIDAFEQDTAGIADNDPTVTSSKRYPYIRADFVEEEQDDEIRRWETLASQIIRNGGPDDVLRNNRRNIISEYRQATKKLLNSVRSDRDCPRFNHATIQQHWLFAQAFDQALEIRRTEDLPEELAQARAVQEAYTRYFYEELGDVGSLRGALAETAVDAVKAALTSDGVAPAQAEALVPLLENLRAGYAQREAAGDPPDQFEVDRDMQEIFRRAQVDYDPAATERELFGSAIAGGQSISSLYRSMVLGQAVAPTGKTLGALSVLVDLAEIGNALLDLKSLFALNDDVMPVVLAVTENAAHLAVLNERYIQFHDEFDTFALEYRRLAEEAARRGQQ